FYCFKIQRLFDFDNDGEWDNDIELFDYISDKGLIKRYFFLKDLIVTNERGDPIGKMDGKIVSQLIDFHLE
ncbi:MAG: hypothetical protein ACE5QV_08895, partial [Fidelibacterota bacterium]